MESIAFFGKGGIGKSTIASNVSVILGAGGSKVLHVGCDPKMDSTLSLMGRHIEPFTALAGHNNASALEKCVQPSRVRGVSCIEAGGPQPGVGCAGTGIGAMLDAMKDGALLERGGYGAAVFDVLGDVVCGGFAAPLRRGFARKAVIVVSEEALSLYAANKLIQMVENYSRNGVFLAGLAVNAKKPEGARLAAEFARAVNTRVLGVIPRDAAVALAERQHRPAVLAYPKSPFSVSLVRLCAAIKAARPQAKRPAALSDADFFAFIEGKTFSRGPAQAPAPRERASAAALLAGAGLRPTGMEGGQLLCGWLYKGRELKIIIAPRRAALPGMLEFSDWSACFHPSVKEPPAGSWRAFEAALKGLARLPFDRLLSAFSGENFYDGLQKFVGAASPLEAAGGAPRRPHVGFGQWQRFIFPQGGRSIFTPPGVVMVEHGDSECRFSGCEGGTLGMFRAGGGHGVARRSGRGPLLPKADKAVFNTDFRASDAAAGDEAKMGAAINGAACRARKGGLVEFYVGCAPMMAAGDVAAFTTGAEAPAGVKVLAQNYNSFNEYSPEKAAAREDYLARRLAAAARRPAWDVNLLGLGDARGELEALLAAGGIKAAPASEDFYAAAAGSRLQVLERADQVLEGALARAGRRFIVPPAPYGAGGTAAWLKAVHAALGVKKKPAARGGLAGELASLRARSRAYAAGFVVSAEELLTFSSVEAFGGVPVPAFLAEAGFALKFFLPREDARRAAAALAALRARLPGCRVSGAYFGGREELAALLRAPGPLRIVYSDISRDPRVTAAGRTPFSSGLFEAGYAGALETAARLLELCEWDFNEKYLARR